MPRHPTKDYICPTCGVVFRASTTHREGSAGKFCPDGHWTSDNRLKSHLKSLGNPPLESSGAVKKLSRMGIGERNEQLSVALRWMLAGYDKAIATLPEKSVARSMVDGAFGRLPAMAREILG